MIKKQKFETNQMICFLMGLLMIYTDTFQMNLTCFSKPFFLFYLRRNREKKKLSFNPPPLSTHARKV